MKRISIIVVITVVVALGVCLFCVIKSYTSQFGTSYSKDSNDWSSFADYLGGIGNTLISLASLIIIGLISILLGRDKNDYKYEQRNQAYDQMISYVPKFHVAATILSHINSNFGRQASWIKEDVENAQSISSQEELKEIVQAFTSQRKNITIQFVKEFNEQLVVFYEYRYNLKNFYPRYGRFFKKYEFAGDYEKLIESAGLLTSDLEEYKKILTGESDKQIDAVKIEKSVETHIGHLTDFINELLKEMK